MIPETSVSTYISGLESLNLDLEDGTGFDWHYHNFWKNASRPIKLYGKGTDVDTNFIYGYYGVANRAAELEAKGLFTGKPVWIANHHRALLDILYEYLIKYERVGYAKGCVEDYFYEEEEAKRLFAHILKMKPHLSEDAREVLDEWLVREFRRWYKSWSRPKSIGDVQTPESSGDAQDLDQFKDQFLWG